MMRKFIVVLTVTLGFVTTAFADEGMWMLNLLKQQKLTEMKSMGLELEDYDIYNPDGSSLKDAVVQFGRGCTGEVISSQGLVLTNHHCGYSQIQSHSSIENNLLDDGFWAKSFDEELPNPGLTVTFIERIDDVTDYVTECLKRDSNEDSLGVFYLSPAYLNKIAIEKVGEEYLKANLGYEVEIKPFFEGNQYYMFTKKIYSDIRLVGTPPSSIGKFGADTDNWMWPRHTGDFSIFRIYANKEGNPAPYSADNIPLKPKRWLKISNEGVDEGDFAMMLGFPGTTNKYYTSGEVAERRDIDNSVRINMREVRQNAMLEEMLNNPEVKIQYAAKYSGSTNAYKNAIGTNWAIDLRDFEGLKKAEEQRLIKWAQDNNEPLYIEALNEIENILNERANLRYRSWMLNEGITRAIEFAAVSTKSSDELADAIESGVGDLEVLHENLLNDFNRFANKDYNVEVDKKIAKTMIKSYTSLIDKDKQPEFFNQIYAEFDGDIDRFIDYIFENSIFGNSDNINHFLASEAKSAETLRNDPMFLFVKSVREEAADLSRKLSTYNIPFAKARKTYIKGILEMDGPYKHFPDANLSLRLTYGQVKGYNPRDAVTYSHQTTLKGVIEKEDSSNWEFVVPEKLKELYLKKDYGNYKLGEDIMPVNFVATTHTTGGNSGSPVLNGRGELIGINFDRNWEGVGGDIQYLPDYQRSIIVDIRYVLFIIEKFANSTHLIEELEL
jgi:hypothetical protein